MSWFVVPPTTAVAHVVLFLLFLAPFVLHGQFPLNRLAQMQPLHRFRQHDFNDLQGDEHRIPQICPKRVAVTMFKHHVFRRRVVVPPIVIGRLVTPHSLQFQHAGRGGGAMFQKFSLGVAHVQVFDHGFTVFQHFNGFVPIVAGFAQPTPQRHCPLGARGQTSKNRSTGAGDAQQSRDKIRKGQHCKLLWSRHANGTSLGGDLWRVGGQKGRRKKGRRKGETKKQRDKETKKQRHKETKKQKNNKETRSM